MKPYLPVFKAFVRHANPLSLASGHLYPRAKPSTAHITWWGPRNSSLNGSKGSPGPTKILQEKELGASFSLPSPTQAPKNDREQLNWYLDGQLAEYLSRVPTIYSYMLSPTPRGLQAPTLRPSHHLYDVGSMVRN